MKEVKIMIKAGYDYTKHEGCGIIIWDYMGHRKEHLEMMDETTCNRCILCLTTKAVESLKEPCNISIYTQCNIGVKFLQNNKWWVNRDLGDKLNMAILTGGHDVSFIDCSQIDDGKRLQYELSSKLRKWRRMQNG